MSWFTIFGLVPNMDWGYVIVTLIGLVIIALLWSDSKATRIFAAIVLLALLNAEWYTGRDLERQVYGRDATSGVETAVTMLYHDDLPLPLDEALKLWRADFPACYK